MTLVVLLASCRAAPSPSPAAPDPCRDHWLCASFGLCTTDGPRCVAALDATCAASRDCAARGACRAVDGFCRAAGETPRDCRGRGTDPYDWCAEGGQCHVVGGRCVALTAEDCAGSARCALFGQCTPIHGSCERGATTDADCREARGSEAHSPCATNGHCTARDGRCVAADDASCRAAEVCRASGMCVAHGGLCIATSRADCAASEACAQDGACAPSGGVCVATPEDCARLPRCQAEPCPVEDGVCRLAPFIYFQF